MYITGTKCVSEKQLNKFFILFILDIDNILDILYIICFLNVIIKKYYKILY